MRVIGNREYGTLPLAKQERTLDVRLALTATENRNLLSVSFDEAVSGKTGASITTQAKGDIFNLDDRTKAFEAASDTIIRALQKDKGLTISDETTDDDNGTRRHDQR
jgi:hypothetical protein